MESYSAPCSMAAQCDSILLSGPSDQHATALPTAQTVSQLAHQATAHERVGVGMPVAQRIMWWILPNGTIVASTCSSRTKRIMHPTQTSAHLCKAPALSSLPTYQACAPKPPIAPSEKAPQRFALAKVLHRSSSHEDYLRESNETSPLLLLLVELWSRLGACRWA